MQISRRNHFNFEMQLFKFITYVEIHRLWMDAFECMYTLHAGLTQLLPCANTLTVLLPNQFQNAHFHCNKAKRKNNYFMLRL